MGSIRNMLKRLGIEAIVADDAKTIAAADKIILPGVGAFDVAMENLHRTGFIEPLNELVIDRKVPILGICLGMQIMSKSSEEGRKHGLGWLDAVTVRFRFDKDERNLKIPHMGWNDIEVCREDGLFKGFDMSARFYFVHSFHMRCHQKKDVLATARYGIDFAAAVRRNNVWGTQFHPEKSHKYGMRLMKNFAEIV